MKLDGPDFPYYCQRFFAEFLPNTRNASPDTLSAYATTFRLLLAFVHRESGKRSYELTVTDLEPELVLRFLDDLETTRKNGVKTRNCRRSAIASFARFIGFVAPQHSDWAARIGLIPEKAAAKTQPIYLTVEEIEAILKSVDQTTWHGRRSHLLCRLAAETGLRNSELRSLRRNSFFLGSKPYLSVEGKGRKERKVPLLSSTKAAIQKWLPEIKAGDDAYLFPNRDGNRLSSDAVQYTVRKYAELGARGCASLARKKVKPHTYRHSAAMVMLDAGMPMPMIATYLGHESIVTTQIYLKLNPEHAAKILAKAKPIAGKQGQKRSLDDETIAFLKQL